MLLKKIKDIWFSWSSLSLSVRFYWCAVAVFVIGIARDRISGSYEVDLLTLTAFSLFAFGFIFRASGFVAGSWRTPWRKVVSVVVHAVVLIMSLASAKRVVSEALGLPAQDFESTVSLLALEFYVLALLVAFAIILMIFSIIAALASWILMISQAPFINDFLLIFSNVFPSNSTIRNFIQVGRGELAFALICHCLGSMIVAAVMVETWDRNIKMFTDNPAIIKVLAYSLDYRNLTQYPGIEHNDMAVLHENGVVSYARLNGWDVNITTGHYYENLEVKSAGGSND